MTLPTGLYWLKLFITPVTHITSITSVIRLPVIHRPRYLLHLLLSLHLCNIQRFDLHCVLHCIRKLAYKYVSRSSSSKN